jgi:hypothetical protein
VGQQPQPVRKPWQQALRPPQLRLRPLTSAGPGSIGTPTQSETGSARREGPARRPTSKITINTNANANANANNPKELTMSFPKPMPRKCDNRKNDNHSKKRYDHRGNCK